MRQYNAFYADSQICYAFFLRPPPGWKELLHIKPAGKLFCAVFESLLCALEIEYGSRAHFDIINFRRNSAVGHPGFLLLQDSGSIATIADNGGHLVTIHSGFSAETAAGGTARHSEAVLRQLAERGLIGRHPDRRGDLRQVLSQ